MVQSNKIIGLPKDSGSETAYLRSMPVVPTSWENAGKAAIAMAGK